MAPRIVVTDIDCEKIAQEFTCNKCNFAIKRYIHTADKGSVGNMTDHVRKCFGNEEYERRKVEKAQTEADAAAAAFAVATHNLPLTNDDLRCAFNSLSLTFLTRLLGSYLLSGSR
jgi:hypothetical protein